MNDLKVGYYVRTIDGKIGQIIKEEFIEPINDKHRWLYLTNADDEMWYDEETIIKSNPNIINLLKKKDIIIDYKGNMYQVVKVWKGYVFTDKKNKYGQIITLVDYQIKKVITKEEFSSIGYEVK